MPHELGEIARVAAGVLPPARGRENPLVLIVRVAAGVRLAVDQERAEQQRERERYR